ncbi:MAG TPA: hypothetical protein VMQ62_05945 [Dongiaceae bacterium]|nr:hypothetical protein [Dongiaceae bacterium]
MFTLRYGKYARATIGVAALFAGSSVSVLDAAEATGTASPAADPPGEVDLLRQEVTALKAEIEALRARLDALQAPAAASATPPAPGGAPAGTAAPPEAPAVPPPAPPPAQAAVPSRSAGLMNPAISAVFQLIGASDASTREDQDGFDLSEAEVAFESTVDPYAKMNLFLTFPASESPEVEEGTVTTLALPAGLQLKGGRFKSSFGRWNTLHTHAFPTVERPLALENYFGEESLTNDGLSLSWLVPNPWGLYLDSTTEVGTARENPSFNSVDRALTWSEHLSGLFNPTANATIEAGASYAAGRTGPGDALLAAIDAAGLTGVVAPDDRSASAVAGADVTWKWKPLQHNTERSFLWQTEVLRSHRDQESLAGSALVDGSIATLGGYTYLEAQWRKRWRWGVRGDLSGYPDSETARAWGVAGVVRFIPSEFQEIRFQVRHSRFNDEAAALQDGDDADTRLFFEWIPVIGAHGAHRY